MKKGMGGRKSVYL